jgi:deoxycytidine triphosphate deaminase
MSVLNNIQIRESITNGRIICYPFNPDHVTPTSLTVTLGYYYYRIESANKRTLYNPFDREDVERYFDGPYKAMPHTEWCNLNGLKPVAGIPDNHPVIALKPGERILAHTHEFFGIKTSGACETKGQDNWSRSGIEITLDAGWINPGDVNRRTLTIHNLNQYETVLLPVGERIAQVLFHETGTINTTSGLQSNDQTSQYQSGTDLETLVRTWLPSLMLPQAWKDQRNLPQKVEGMSYE